jgi:hypothetical protein
MFVFWYCHKRGKQVRLDRETEAGEAGEASKTDEAEGGSDFDATDSEGGDVDDAAEKIAQAVKNDSAESSGAKDDVLNQPEPAQVPLPDAEKGEKGAALEAEKSVGV